jgi:hypothetical protein
MDDEHVEAELSVQDGVEGSMMMEGSRFKLELGHWWAVVHFSTAYYSINFGTEMCN